MIFLVWRSLRRSLLGLAALWLLAGVAFSTSFAPLHSQGSQTPSASELAEELEAAQQTIRVLQEELQRRSAATTDTSSGESYLIAPGDVLSLYVWQEPDLSGTARVSLDGKITVRLIGDVNAEGRTTEELSQEVASRLGDLLEFPVVTVGIEEAASARVFVIGEVMSSGAFQLIGTTTVAQAIALAGGFSDFAKRERIRIIRQLESGQVAIPFDFNDLGRGKNLAQNFELQAGDTIIVP